jgi:hypothetical protein
MPTKEVRIPPVESCRKGLFVLFLLRVHPFLCVPLLKVMGCRVISTNNRVLDQRQETLFQGVDDLLMGLNVLVGVWPCIHYLSENIFMGIFQWKFHLG